MPANATADARQTIRDFSKAKPAADAVLPDLQRYVRYDRTPLNAKLESVAQDSTDWRKEKITFDAAYGKERWPRICSCPRARAAAVPDRRLFFPARAGSISPRAKRSGDMKLYRLRDSERAGGLYPVYKGTYERPAAMAAPDTREGRETLIEDSKDIGRSIDYLETRADIDRNRIAYLGVSMGAALGVNFAGGGRPFQGRDLYRWWILRR